MATTNVSSGSDYRESWLSLTKGDAGVSVARVTNIRDIEPPPYVIPLSLDGREALTFEPQPQSGWAGYHSDELEQGGVQVFIRIGPRDEGTQKAEVVFVDGKPGVRMVPPEVTPTTPLEIRELRVIAQSGADASSTVLRTIPWDRIEAAINQRAHRSVLAEWVKPAFAVADSMPGESLSFAFRPDPMQVRQPDLRLEVPQGYRKPDAFYERVADLFLWLAAISSRPAQELAEANEVKPSTVHRWLGEARARGLLVLPTNRRSK
ncbi:hypothetical protein AB0D67_17260 [Streptosporangium sp. NPDC048047]|uniref:hypothetical protein n=1 Tax=Streptosporangium sp. NPDC048047 TaxID=3155748 RepID=UPI003442ADC4